MTQVTITKLGEVKTVPYTNKRTGKPDSFNKVGFQTQEHGQQWINFIFRTGSHGLAVGNSYDMELVSKEFNGKTYYDAKMAKNVNGTQKPTQLSDSAELARIMNTLSMKVLPALERIEQKIDGLEYPERNESNTPEF